MTASYDSYKLVDRDGMTSVIMHDNRLLLLKRPNLPFIISSPGTWGFVQGGRKKNERYIETAYREIFEETKLKRENLRLIARRRHILLFDPVHLGKKWYNAFFIFKSDTGDVTLDFENRAYRWAPMKDILRERNYSNAFLDKAKINRLISTSLE